MCLIAFHWQPLAAVKLVIAANRDEFYARPALKLHHWEDQPIVAGKDLHAGGTWLGMSTTGRVAALTNFRDVARQRADAPSRGSITSAFLGGTTSAQDYLAKLSARAAHFNPFNLLVFDGTSLLGFESRHLRVVPFEAGAHAISNADFNVPWPKLSRLRSGMESVVQGSNLEARLFELLAERQTAPDTLLPRTGIPMERERALSATFIHTPDYGTRCSTVLWVANGQAVLTERSFGREGFQGEARQHIRWATAL